MSESPNLLGMSVIAAENTVRYLAPVYWGDTLTAGTRVARIGTKSLLFEYALHRASDDKIVADGRTVLVWYDYARKQSAPVPDTFRAAVERVQGPLNQQ